MDIEIKEQPERVYIGIRTIVPADKIMETVEPLYEKVFAYAEQAGGEITGGALAIYHSDPAADYDMECAVPVANAIPGEGDIQPDSLKGGKIAFTTHHGPYDGLKSAWEEFAKTGSEQGIKTDLPFWEEYVVCSDSESDPSKWVTVLACPIK